LGILGKKKLNPMLILIAGLTVFEISLKTTVYYKEVDLKTTLD
jgi:hypothetical protein